MTSPQVEEGGAAYRTPFPNSFNLMRQLRHWPGSHSLSALYTLGIGAGGACGSPCTAAGMR